MADLCDHDAVTLAGMLRRREVSAREVVTAHARRIEALDGVINAVVTRSLGTALHKAGLADAELARGREPGPLHGLPVAHKDLADTAGVRTTYGSVLFAGHVPDRDDLVVARMAGRGDQPGQDEHAGVRGGLANFQRGVRRHPQPVGPRQTARAAAAAARPRRWPAGCLPGRWQRPGRVAAQSGQLLQRGGPAALTGPGAVLAGGRSGRRARVAGPMARTVADVALMLSVLGPTPGCRSRSTRRCR